MSGYRNLRGAGLLEHIEAISASGCFSGKDGGYSIKGHEWVPVEELGEDHPAIALMGWSYSQECPLREAAWTFNPYCTECRQYALEWMTSRGVNRKEWRRIVETFGIHLPLNAEEKEEMRTDEEKRQVELAREARDTDDRVYSWILW